MRLDKNGIRILDPVGENKLKKRRKCLPDEHFWEEVNDPIKDLKASGTHYQCTRCDEKDFEPDPLDEQDLPWL